jgi:glucose/arabinose dehydrogenase
MIRLDSVVAASRVVSLLGAAVASLPAQDEPRALVEAQRVYDAQAKFDKPLFVAFHETDPGWAYVVVQPGQIFRVDRAGESEERHTFLDLAGKVYFGDNWEEGLLGFAFDPGYAENRQVFACWSEETEVREGSVGTDKRARSKRQSVIARYEVVPDENGRPVVDLASELRVMEIFQPYGNHNGGTILFGPDRMLYVALGDGGAARDPYMTGQDKGSLLGKVLRIDVSAATPEQPYQIPDDNPFVGEEGARGEIYCYGMRNPWRIAFDRETGDLWCGDVGQNRFEEVDRLVKGGNYGWNVMEANEVFDKKAEMPVDLLAPIATYPRKDGVSITGGHVYRGKLMPDLVGCYIYGDFATFRIWAVREDAAAGNHQVREIGRAPGPLSSFAEEPDGELLMTCFNGNVYRIVPRTAGN